MVVKARVEGVGSACDGRRGGEAYLACGQDRAAFRQLSHGLADGNTVRGSSARHVAVEANPVDGGCRAVSLPGIGLRKLSRILGERPHQHADDVSVLTEAPAPLIIGEVGGAGRTVVLRREHRNRLPNICSFINHLKASISTPKPAPHTLFPAGLRVRYEAPRGARPPGARRNPAGPRRSPVPSTGGPPAP